MHTLLITLQGPKHRVDLEVPAEVSVGALLAKLQELYAPPARRTTRNLPWHLWLQDESRPLKSFQSLREAGVLDGSILLLQQGRARKGAEEPTSFTPKDILPTIKTGGIGVKWQMAEV